MKTGKTNERPRKSGNTKGKPKEFQSKTKGNIKHTAENNTMKHMENLRKPNRKTKRTPNITRKTKGTHLGKPEENKGEQRQIKGTPKENHSKTNGANEKLSSTLGQLLENQHTWKT